MHILKRIHSYIIFEEINILNIMKKMNKVKYKFLIVVNKNKQFLGTITDGDLRRNIIKKKFDQNLTAKDVMARNTITSFSLNEFEHREIMKRKSILFLPVINRKRKILQISVNKKIVDFHKKKIKFKEKIILMAGGKGLRLRPFTKNLPKPMLKISKKRIIEKIIIDFVNQGFYDFIITVNYLKAKIQKFIGNGSKFGCKVNFLEEKKYMGTAGSLTKINLKNYNQDTIIVMNSDLITNINYKQLIDFHRKKKADLTICSKFKSFTVPFGEIEIDKNLNIKRIKEKPLKSYFVNLGIYVFNYSYFKKLKKHNFKMMNDVINNMLQKGHKVITFPVYEEWQDIGNKEDYLKLINKK